MQLEGSCHCGSVRFTVNSSQPYPFNQCYCSICRKTAGEAVLLLTWGRITQH
ncbi:GFA family protein [Amphritea pacifica]